MVFVCAELLVYAPCYWAVFHGRAVTSLSLFVVICDVWFGRVGQWFELSD